MADTTVIGRATFVRGRVSGSGDLEIAGRVEGDVACSGEVLIDATGLVAANVSARRIVVRGAVKGDLVAEDALVIEAGAKVVGDLRAPRVAIAEGGMVKGHVQTGAAGAPRAREKAAVRPAAAPARAEKIAPPPVTRPTAKTANGPAQKAPPRGATLAGARVGPPPPVVPALKKGTKAVQKKR
jgi:cytoskeletal protein CcmA (bactofilin family)